jgi:hypothetical protein
MRMRVCSAAAAVAFIAIYLGSVRPASADVIGKLFQADTMPWTVLVFVIGMLVGATVIHLLRKNR